MPGVDARRRALSGAMLACGAWPTLVRAASPAASSGASWSGAPPLPDAQLVDHLGRAVWLRRVLREQTGVVISFFYTGCSTVCPPQTALLRDLRQQLDSRTDTRRVLLVSISVDPLGDGPDQLRDHLRRFQIDAGPDKGWLWLTGQPAEVSGVLRGFGVKPSAAADHPNLLWMADIRRERWTRTAALQEPRQVAQRLQELLS